MKSRFLSVSIVGFFSIAIALTFPFAYLSQTRHLEKITIPASNYQITGYISPGSVPDNPWAIFIHGNRKVGQSHILYQKIANNISPEINLLALDLRGFGESIAYEPQTEGPVLDRTGDIEAARSYLIEKYSIEDETIILIGHSLGAVQVLKAAKLHPYRHVFSIGPGDFESFLDDPDKMRGYIEKFNSNSNLELTEERMSEEGRELAAQSLFSSCPLSPTVLIFGAFEDKAVTRTYQQSIRPECPERLEWVTIPISDHMYGTEISKLIIPFRSVYSNLSISLLVWKLNRRLIEESETG